jgi:thiamine kinase-like enzyme
MKYSIPSLLHQFGHVPSTVKRSAGYFFRSLLCLVSPRRLFYRTPNQPVYQFVYMKMPPRLLSENLEPSSQSLTEMETHGLRKFADFATILSLDELEHHPQLFLQKLFRCIPVRLQIWDFAHTPSANQDALSDIFRMTKIPGAMSNHVFCLSINSKFCHLKDKTEPDRLLLKIYRQEFKPPTAPSTATEGEAAAEQALSTSQIIEHLKQSQRQDEEDSLPLMFSVDYFDHYLESSWMNSLASLDEPLSPCIYIDFVNGRLEEFIQGATLRTEQMKYPAMMHQIARKMAALHRHSPVLFDLTRQVYLHVRHREIKNIHSPLDCPKYYWKIIKKSYFKAVSVLQELQLPRCQDWNDIQQLILYDKEFTKEFIEAELLTLKLDELEWYKQELEVEQEEKAEEGKAASNKSNSLNKTSTLSFIHLDLQPGNIMLDKYNQLVFIDYEYGNFGPSLLDIANHFCEWAFIYDNDKNRILYDRDGYPTLPQMLSFLHSYYGLQADPPSTATSSLSGHRNLQTASNVNLQTCIEKILFYMLIADLKWLFWSIGKFADRFKEEIMEEKEEQEKQDTHQTNLIIEKWRFYLTLCRHKITHFRSHIDYLQYARNMTR